MRQMEHIGKALERFLRGNQLERRVAEYQVVLAWKAAVGAEIAAHSEARDLTRGVLWVTVSGSSWTQHIMFLKPKILEALRREFPDVHVSDIRCVVGGR
jgi:predicted nucleic acid-binding Zn ribbon protein